MESFKHLEVDGKLYAWPSSRRYDQWSKIPMDRLDIPQRWAKAVGLHNEDDIRMGRVEELNQDSYRKGSGRKRSW